MPLRASFVPGGGRVAAPVGAPALVRRWRRPGAETTRVGHGMGGGRGGGSSCGRGCARRARRRRRGYFCCAAPIGRRSWVNPEPEESVLERLSPSDLRARPAPARARRHPRDELATAAFVRRRPLAREPSSSSRSSCSRRGLDEPPAAGSARWRCRRWSQRSSDCPPSPPLQHAADRPPAPAGRGLAGSADAVLVAALSVAWPAASWSWCARGCPKRAGLADLQVGDGRRGGALPPARGSARSSRTPRWPGERWRRWSGGPGGGVLPHHAQALLEKNACRGARVRARGAAQGEVRRPRSRRDL